MVTGATSAKGCGEEALIDSSVGNIPYFSVRLAPYHADARKPRRAHDLIPAGE